MAITPHTPAGETKLVVSSSPHIHTGETNADIMWSVVVSLVPPTLIAFYLFGLPAVRVVLVTVLACLVAEEVACRMRKIASTIGDGSAAVTGLLLALTLPPSAPSWICIAGALFAILIAKQAFGGLGFNVFNPALAGRVFLLISFPYPMTAVWPVPTYLKDNLGLDAVTGATPLITLREQPLEDFYEFVNLGNLLWGNTNGSLGETSAIALILGGLYLWRKDIITWHIPVSMVGTVAALTAVFWLYRPEAYAAPWYHVISGGLLLGAIFMATDLVTSPQTGKGMLVFGCLCGVLTVVIRLWGGYPEGVSFSIIIMNAAVPLIDRYARPKVYGVQPARLTGKPT